MLKTKYLHRPYRKTKNSHLWGIKKYWRGKNIDLLSDLPPHERMRRGYHNYNYDTTPLLRFLDSKVGQNWNDVYSEVLTKIKNKYRWCIDSYLHADKYWHRVGVYIKPIYDDDFIPRNSIGRILKNHLFVENGILVEKDEPEIRSDAIKYQRKEKLNKILENKDKEYIEFDQKLYEDFFIKDGEERVRKYKRN